jgi:outer membrane protein TolC
MMRLFAFIALMSVTWPLTSQECVPDKNSECLLLTLQSATSRALNHNRQLINTIDSNVRAEYNVALAQSQFDLQFIPNSRLGYTGDGRDGTGAAIGGGIDISKQFTTGTRVSVGPAILKTPKHYQTNVRAVISQPLLKGFGRDYQLSGIRSAKFALRSAYRSIYVAQVQLLLRTIQSLYEVIKAQKTVEINRESYNRVEKFFQTAKLKEKIGLSDSLDIYRAQIEFQQSEDQLTTSQERLEEAEDALRDLLALPLETCIRVEVPLVYKGENVVEEEAIFTALAKRIEMDQAEDIWRENYRVSKLAKNNLYPDVNLVLDYTNSGYDEVFTETWRCKRENKWGIGVTTSGQFNPTSEVFSYEQSLLTVNAAERGMEQTKASLTLEVKRIVRQLQRIDKRIALQEKQIKTAEGQLYLAQLKFNRGMANNFDVIQSEKTLHSAQIGYWGAIIDRIVGEYQFLAAIGLLTDKPCIK